MKKIVRGFVLAMALTCILALGACGKDDDVNEENSSIENVTEDWGLGIIMPEKNGN